MISFPAQSEILVIHTPVSFGCGIDGMLRYVQILLDKECIDRGYFIFVNKRKTQVRTLWYDGQGNCLFLKRLSSGSYKNWPKVSDTAATFIKFFEANDLLAGATISRKNYAKIWKNIDSDLDDK